MGDGRLLFSGTYRFPAFSYVVKTAARSAESHYDYYRARRAFIYHRGRLHYQLLPRKGGAESRLSHRARGPGEGLDTAYDYLVENENTLCIVSGGQGANEPHSEAQGMYDYLVEKGIAKERIIMEDKSTDTSENIAFSSVFLDMEKDRVGIVTNNFHVFRGVHLAKHQGIRNVCGIAAPSNIYFQLNNMVREFFGILKDLVCGNLI